MRKGVRFHLGSTVVRRIVLDAFEARRSKRLHLVIFVWRSWQFHGRPTCFRGVLLKVESWDDAVRFLASRLSQPGEAQRKQPQIRMNVGHSAQQVCRYPPPRLLASGSLICGQARRYADTGRRPLVTLLAACLGLLCDGERGKHHYSEVAQSTTDSLRKEGSSPQS